MVQWVWVDGLLDIMTPASTVTALSLYTEVINCISAGVHIDWWKFPKLWLETAVRGIFEKSLGTRLFNLI